MLSPRAVVCTYCKVAIGEPCRARKTRRMMFDYHEKRLLLAGAPSQKGRPRAYIETPWYRMSWQSAFNRARAAGIPFSLSEEDIKAAWPPGGVCPIMGVAMDRNGDVPGFRPSIDRVTPKLGYVPGNIAIISRRANVLKRDETDPDVFRRIAAYIESFDEPF